MPSLTSYADGVPLAPFVALPDAPDTYQARPSSVRRTVEGLRNRPARVAVYLRYVGWLLGVITCSAISGAAFAADPRWHMGGLLMLCSAATMFATAALGTFGQPAHRNQILDQVRHFVFGISVIPGTGIALFMWVTRGLSAQASNGSDAFVALLGNALPVVFLCTVLIPPAVFIKAVGGLRTLNRSQMDDEEQLAMWSRQDGLQR